MIKDGRDHIDNCCWINGDSKWAIDLYAEEAIIITLLYFIFVNYLDTY